MSVDRGRWATGGPETVAPGVHRIPLPLPNDGLHAVNVYVLEQDIEKRLLRQYLDRL